MTEFLELTLSGVSLGSIYALIAIGFVLVFKATGIVNFAHGSILLLGAYVAARLQSDLGFWVALLAGAAAAAIVAALVDVALLRRLRAGAAGTLAIVTLGVDIVLATEITRRLGAEILPSGARWGSSVAQLGSLAIAQARVAAAVIALVLIGCFAVALQRTDCTGRGGRRVLHQLPVGRRRLRRRW